MDLAALQKKLMQVAQANPPSERVPYLFEQRIMARLRTAASADPVVLWGQALWKAAVSCVLVTLLFSAWSVLSPAGPESLAEDFETTIVAGLNQSDSGW
jgi:hypothetical protein